MQVIDSQGTQGKKLCVSLQYIVCLPSKIETKNQNIIFCSIHALMHSQHSMLLSIHFHNVLFFSPSGHNSLARCIQPHLECEFSLLKYRRNDFKVDRISYVTELTLWTFDCKLLLTFIIFIIRKVTICTCLMTSP